MEIEIYQTKNYGRIDWYVADPKKAEAIRLISGKETLTTVTRVGLSQLGFTFKEVLPTIK